MSVLAKSMGKPCDPVSLATRSTLPSGQPCDQVNFALRSTLRPVRASDQIRLAIRSTLRSSQLAPTGEVRAERREERGEDRPPNLLFLFFVCVCALCVISVCSCFCICFICFTKSEARL